MSYKTGQNIVNMPRGYWIIITLSKRFVVHIMDNICLTICYFFIIKA